MSHKVPLITLLLSLAGLTIACSSAAKVLDVPLPEVVGTHSTDGFPGLNYTVYVHCTVRNSGASGNVTVSANLANGGSWTKRTSAFIASGSEKEVRIAFPEASLLGTGLGGYRFQCGAS